MKIINSQEKQNLLLDRKEVRIAVEAEITPSRFEVLKVVVEKFSCSEDVVNILKIDSNFGTKVFTIIADIYGSKEAKELIAVKRKKEFEAGKKVEEEKKKETAKPVESTKQPVETNVQEEKEDLKEVPEQDSETKEEFPGQVEEKEDKKE